MQKWEYKVVLIDPDSCEQELNRLGEQGWEFVTCAGGYILKRPKAEKPPTLPPIRK